MKQTGVFWTQMNKSIDGKTYFCKFPIALKYWNVNMVTPLWYMVTPTVILFTAIDLQFLVLCKKMRL